MFEIKKEGSFRSDSVIYNYVFVDGEEAGFVAHDLKAKTFQFFYDNTVTVDNRTSPEFATKKEMVAWLNATFG